MDTRERIDCLKELKDLHEAGVLTEIEYSNARAQVLRSSPTLSESLERYLPTLIKLAWPCVAIVVLMALHEPLISKLQEAQQMSIGGFSIKVRDEIVASGSPQLAKALSGLSQTAIELLMDIGDKDMRVAGEATDSTGSVTAISVTIDKFKYVELERKGFLSGNEPYSEFIKWVVSLPGKVEIFYHVTASGEESIGRPDEPYVVYEIYSIDVSKISETDKKKLLNTYYTLSKEGLKVWKLIAKVVAEQLSSS